MRASLVVSGRPDPDACVLPSFSPGVKALEGGHHAQFDTREKRNMERMREGEKERNQGKH